LFATHTRTAPRRVIPFVWFPGEPHTAGTARSDTVKDIRSGDQVPADPASWLPPESDLRPQVVISKVDE
jgi:histidyl-tRNA synthetase